MTEQLTIADLEYDLPQERIATCPVNPRSSAKLLVVHKNSFEDCCMKDFPSLLPENALLVANESAVLPARFMAVRKDSGGKVEGLFLEEHSQGWCVMLKSNGKLRAGIMLEVANGIDLTLLERSGANWICSCSSSRSPQEILLEVGTTPIPPYILRARGEEHVPDSIDREQYQTVFAKKTQRESVAAPNHVADGEYAAVVGAQTCIHLHAVGVEGDSGAFQPQIVDPGPAAGGHQDMRARDGVFGAVGIANRHHHALVRSRDAGDDGALAYLDAVVRQPVAHDAHQIGVVSRHDRDLLDHAHPCPELAERLRHLDADRTAADDDEMLGQPGEIEDGLVGEVTRLREPGNRRDQGP